MEFGGGGGRGRGRDRERAAGGGGGGGVVTELEGGEGLLEVGVSPNGHRDAPPLVLAVDEQQV